MNLIYFFMGSNPEIALEKDYIISPFEICYLFYFKSSLDSLNSFFGSFRSKLRTDHFFQNNLDDFFPNFNTILKNQFNKKSSNESSITFYIKEVQFIPNDLNVENSITETFKFLLEILHKYFQDNRKELDSPIIIDLTNCPSDLLGFIYFIIINNCQTESNEIFENIIWNIKTQKSYVLPLKFIDPTSLNILELIFEGINTIKDLQEIYTKFKKSEKVVSQPFISKYISILSKESLIREEWIDGIKHFYTTTNANLYMHSKKYIQQKVKEDFKDIEKDNYSNIPSKDLIQKAIDFYYSKKTSELNIVLDQLIKRTDLNKDIITLFLEKVNLFQNGKFHQFLEHANFCVPNNDQILTYLAKSYIERKDVQKGVELLKQAIKINPDNGMAWELISKNIAYK